MLDNPFREEIIFELTMIDYRGSLKSRLKLNWQILEVGDVSPSPGTGMGLRVLILHPVPLALCSNKNYSDIILVLIRMS